MNIVYTNNRYGSGEGPRHDSRYDYLLFRQDWSGNESVYFNADEIKDVSDKILNDEILIHHNYSILYCRTEELLKKVEDYFGCYATVIK